MAEAQANGGATAPATSAPTPGSYRYVAVHKIEPSKSNPRKVFNGIDELAASFLAKGVLQPLQLRPLDDGAFEIIFGERRWRAARKAGLETVPAVVRADLSEQDVALLRLAENVEREDLSPLEEADGYRDLQKRFAYTAEQLAARFNRSKSSIYAALKIAELGPAGRAALAKGMLTASTALLVARIPDGQLQAAAVKDLLENGTEPVSYRGALDHIQRHYMLQLKDAPFDTTSAELVPKAGPCTTCPKRTGNQRELFADVTSTDVCTDPPCYEKKKTALWQLRVSKAKETGQTVLSQEQAKRAFPYGQLAYDSEYVDLSERDYAVQKTYKQVLAKDAPAPILARHPKTGELVELMKKEDFNKFSTGKKVSVPRKLQKAKVGAGTAAADNWKKRNAERQKAEKTRETVHAAVMAKLLAEVEKGGTSAKFWRLLATPLLRDWSRRAVVTRRWGARAPDKKVDAAIAKMTDRQLRGLVFELVLVDDNLGDTPGIVEHVAAACKAFGIDADKIAAEVAPAAAAPAKKKAKKK